VHGRDRRARRREGDGLAAGDRWPIEAVVKKGFER
jgi:hypothetical protein